LPNLQAAVLAFSPANGTPTTPGDWDSTRIPAAEIIRNGPPKAGLAAILSLRGGAMVRYFFDIRDDTGLYADDEGLEFRTQREAEIEATQTLSGLARDLAGHEDRTDVAIEVRTDAGRVFQAALIFEPPTTKQ
jgi:hypothetical protein